VTPETIILIAVVIVAIVAVGWFAVQRRRSETLRAQFGPEYERTVEHASDRARAEADLQERRERVDAFEIRPLGTPAHHRFSEDWASVQAMFVDDPAAAVEQADGLIGDVMRARGYPVGDFEQRAADLSVDHPTVVEHYREAHRIARASRDGSGDTEALRRAFVHYRALFADLLERASAPGRRAATEQPLTRTRRAS
jgi:FtsZ-interacting cell division protein ZipA